MNIQFDTAFKIFVDLYGMPNWETNPKDGQKREEIIDMWSENLKRYTVDQVKQAAYRVYKFSKSRSFPTLNHLLAELSQHQPDENLSPQQEADRCYVYLLNHGHEPMHASRTIYDLYGVKKGGYEPKNDPVYISNPQIYKRKV